MKQKGDKELSVENFELVVVLALKVGGNIYNGDVGVEYGQSGIDY